MKLHEMLGTKNRGEQERQVEALIHAAQAPTVVVAIVWDVRTNELNVVPITGDVPFQVIYSLLEQARYLMQAHERQALLEQQVTDNSPATEQVVESTL